MDKLSEEQMLGYWFKEFADLGHWFDSEHKKCVNCGVPTIDLYEDGHYGKVRRCAASEHHQRYTPQQHQMKVAELPREVSRGTVTLFGIQIDVIQLDNGQRILDADGFEQLMRVMAAEGLDMKNITPAEGEQG